MSFLDEILAEAAKRAREGYSIDFAKPGIKALMLELFGEALQAETVAEMGDIFRQKVNDL